MNQGYRDILSTLPNVMQSSTTLPGSNSGSWSPRRGPYALLLLVIVAGQSLANDHPRPLNRPADCVFGIIGGEDEPRLLAGFSKGLAQVPNHILYAAGIGKAFVADPEIDFLYSVVFIRPKSCH